MDGAHPRLDEGGFARLDVSDLGGDPGGPGEDEGHAPALRRSCDWCDDAPRGGGEYLVVADNRHYALCPTCWGRSPGYVDLRQRGVGHGEALTHMGIHSAAT